MTVTNWYIQHSNRSGGVVSQGWRAAWAEAIFCSHTEREESLSDMRWKTLLWVVSWEHNNKVLRATWQEVHTNQVIQYTITRAHNRESNEYTNWSIDTLIMLLLLLLKRYVCHVTHYVSKWILPFNTLPITYSQPNSYTCVYWCMCCTYSEEKANLTSLEHWYWYCGEYTHTHRHTVVVIATCVLPCWGSHSSTDTIVSRGILPQTLERCFSWS